MLPEEVLEILEEYTDDDFNLYVTGTSFDEDEFKMDFSLDVQDINGKGEIFEKWTVKVKGHRESSISFDSADGVEIAYNHPLLWKYHGTQCQLYYRGKCTEPTKLFYDLFCTHRDTFGNHKQFNINFGHDVNYFKAFQYSNGLLTEGSKPLMELYAKCLERSGLEAQFIGERPGTFWDGEKHVEEAEPLAVLLFGKTYIIGQDFQFERRTLPVK